MYHPPIALLFLTFFLSFFRSSAQDHALARKLYDQYDRYRENSIHDLRFKHADIVPLVARVQGRAGMEVRQVGQSVEGRSINLVRFGQGKTRVLLWSQMHGDEPTATMAMMDLFNFLSASGDGFDDLRQRIRSELSLYFIPMLNPDGAEAFVRYNAIGVDLNRDAVRLQCPESKVLKKVRDELQPQWGFNLHDQRRVYSAGDHPHTATFSFLAPAYDPGQSVNEVRKRAMQLVVALDQVVQKYLPGQVGKWDDTFEPRAFGDNIQKWGTSTVLIECGGLQGDPEKQEIRKLHFVLYLVAFDAIIRESFRQKTIVDYFAIPQNDDNFFELLVRGVKVPFGSESYVLDLGFQQHDISYDGNRAHYQKAYLADVGDLSVFFGYEEIDGRGMTLEPGQLYPHVLENLAALERLDPKELYRQGYTDVRLRNLPSAEERYEQPFNLLSARSRTADNDIRRGTNPGFFLVEQGVRKYAIVNGRAFRLGK